MKELSKVYDPKQVEDRTYQFWLDGGYFHAEPNPDKKPYTIVIPPPNITGQLHMGHALDETLQDILIRFRRMQGYETLWLPGTDHASIATEAKIVNAMKEEGLTKEDLGREGFLERAWEWKRKYGGRIIEQLKKLGSSCDWERERFTLDEGCSQAVKEVFVNLYNKGLIYQGERIINWCPHCMTSISDAEVEYEEQAGHFWHLRYPLSDGSGEVILATTRPETMLGDTAVAVNPKDERYQKLIGKTVILPLVNREIPIVGDDYVDMEFGTGVVKITPAHDPNDYEVGRRHDLPILKVMNDDATMTAACGKYAGMERYEARKAIVKDLEEQGYLLKVEDHTHNVGTCYRCGTTVEPMVSKQWFVKMEPLAKPAIDVVRNGQIKLIPERMDKTYYNWMENIKDWCISRQLWWGHRIPAYYCESCGEVVVAKETPSVCPKCGSTHLHQDEDTLDTWFSSALWPFSTLGWPNNTEELKYFYPTSTLVTGYDIIFFWVARMAFQSRYAMKSVPFKEVLIHGLIRDKEGRKMSKSLGNGVDPRDVIADKGADALRFFLTTNSAPGLDLRFDETKVDSAWNFINKIWNASRYVQMQLNEEKPGEVDLDHLSEADQWILYRLNETVASVTRNMDKYELSLAGNELYSFVWNDFCSWYIELSKAALNSDDEQVKNNTRAVLYAVLKEILVLLSPFMPFVTEHIYLAMDYDKESINLESWPAFYNFEKNEQAVEDMAVIISAIEAVREIKAQYGLKPREILNIQLVDENGDVKKLSAQGQALLEGMANAHLMEEKPEGDLLSRTIVGTVIQAALSDLVDPAAEIAKLEKELAVLEKEIARGEKMLSNPGFVNKAPEAKIQVEKNKLAANKERQSLAQAQLADWKSKA